MKKTVIFDSLVNPEICHTAESFRQYAETAAELGATHVSISQIPPSSWQHADGRDPFPQCDSWPVWSRRHVGIFKLYLPKALKPFLPEKEVNNNLNLLEKRCEILRSLGLRAVLEGHEPMWLPEAVFLKYPEWRGPQVECLPLARLPYFSPCVDHPDVLEMYREGMAEVCKRLPELDIYTMLTNDSSCGFCWCHTYPGENGPEACRDISLPERISTFMSALQEGAKKAGGELVVHVTNSRLYLDNNHHHFSVLKKNQYIDGKDNKQQPYAVGSGSNSWFGNNMFPVLGIPRVESFVKELEQANTSKSKRLSVSFGTVMPLLSKVYREFNKNPSTGPASRMALLLKIATDLVGKGQAENLLKVWSKIEDAAERYRFCLRGSPLLIVGPLMMRWTTLPLVPDLSMLEEKELKPILRGRIAKNEEEAFLLTNALGAPGITGDAAVDNLRLVTHMAREDLQAACNLLEEIITEIKKKKMIGELKSLIIRLETLSCLLLSCRNVCEYEHLLVTSSRDNEEVWYRDHFNTGTINRGGYELRLIARSEMDNALALAKLLEETNEEIVAQATAPNVEDALNFPKDVAKQLRNKYRIMMKYWPVYNRLYPPVPEMKGIQIGALEGEEEIND